MKKWLFAGALVIITVIPAFGQSFMGLKAKKPEAPAKKIDFARRTFDATRIALPVAGAVDMATMVWTLNAPTFRQETYYPAENIYAIHIKTWRPEEFGQCSFTGRTNRTGNVLCWSMIYFFWDRMSKRIYDHFDAQSGWQRILRWSVPAANVIFIRNAIRGIRWNIRARRWYETPYPMDPGGIPVG